MTKREVRLTSRDLLRFRMADDPQVSPDGTEVAWVCTWMDAAENRYRSHILVTTIADGATRRLTSGDGLDTHPRWSPDGRFVAYLSTAGPDGATRDAVPEAAPDAAAPQLWVTPADGGDARMLTQGCRGIQDPAWSPDGTRLAFTVLVDPKIGLGRGEESSPDEAEVDPYIKFNRDVLTARRLRWKLDGTGSFGDHRRQVAWVPFEADAARQAPEAVLLTCGEFDLAAPVWSPDGRSIAVVGNLNPDADAVRRQFIYLLDANSKAPVQPQELFGLEEIRHPGLSWSPDGATIAVVGHDDPTIAHYGNHHLWLVSVATGTARCLTRTLDRTLGNAAATDLGRYEGDAGPRWLPAGSGVLVLISDRGIVRLCRIAIDTGEIRSLTQPDHVVTAFTLDGAGQVAVALVREALNPGDLHVLDLEVPPSARLRRLTGVNDELLADVALSPPQRFTFQSGEATVDGWVVPPVDHAPGRRYPTILYHGGGPGGMRGPNFMFEFQLYASAGYAVVYCNTRGCQGYGESFCTAILGEWGGWDYEDNINGILAACERFDFIDPNRLGTAGGSYGGYQVNWIIGHTHLFRAAVSDRSVSNRYSSYGTSDIGHLREFEFGGGPPWETTAAYLTQTPLQFIGNARTPTLVIHSARDLRCPIEQGEQLYMALKRVGVPTELVRFPNESHGLSRGGRPWHRVFRLDKYLEWFGRWLRDEQEEG